MPDIEDLIEAGCYDVDEMIEAGYLSVDPPFEFGDAEEEVEETEEEGAHNEQQDVDGASLDALGSLPSSPQNREVEDF